MRGLKPRRPSAALVIACIALFVSLGGVSYGVATGFIDSREIKNNTIRTQDLRENEVRSGDIRNSTIRGRDVAQESLTGEDIAESTLATVPNSNGLGGLGASGYAKAKQEAVRKPVLVGGYTPAATFLAPGFWKDAIGVVHLEGTVDVPAMPDTAFTLPPGYRPAGRSTFPRRQADFVTIGADGRVDVTGTTTVPLDGITFRAAR